MQTYESRLRDLVLCMGDWIWEIDVDGALVYSCSEVQNLLGYSPDELIGTSIFDLVTAVSQFHSRHN